LKYFFRNKTLRAHGKNSTNPISPLPSTPLLVFLISKNNTNSDVYGHVKTAPPDAIFGIAMAYKADKDPNKVDVCVGAYRDDNGKPYVFDVVRQAQSDIINDPNINKVKRINFSNLIGVPSYRWTRWIQSMYS
jgi:hypothetical protein